MKKIPIIVFIFISLFTISCQNKEDIDSQENQVSVQTQTVPQSKSNTNENNTLIQQQYRDSYFGLHIKRLNECTELWSNQESLKNNYKLELLYAVHGRIPNKIEQEKESINQKIENNKSKIDNIESEMKKVKLDMLKYYQGNPPESFYKEWTESDDKLNNAFCAMNEHSKQTIEFTKMAFEAKKMLFATRIRCLELESSASASPAQNTPMATLVKTIWDRYNNFKYVDLIEKSSETQTDNPEINDHSINEYISNSTFEYSDYLYKLPPNNRRYIKYQVRKIKNSFLESIPCNTIVLFNNDLLQPIFILKITEIIIGVLSFKTTDLSNLIQLHFDEFDEGIDMNTPLGTEFIDLIKKETKKVTDLYYAEFDIEELL